MKLFDRTKLFARKLFNYIYHLLRKKPKYIAIEVKSKLVLDYHFVHDVLEKTTDGTYRWQLRYGRYVHESHNLSICFKPDKEVVSGDERILMVVAQTGMDAALTYFYPEDTEWGVVNQLKQAIVKSLEVKTDV